MTVRQYRMLQRLRNVSRLPLPAAEQLDQRTFGSLCRNRWLEFDFRREVSEGWFQLSKEGEQELDRFGSWTMTRNHPENDLSKFVFGVALRARKKMRALRRAA